MCGIIVVIIGFCIYISANGSVAAHNIDSLPVYDSAIAFVSIGIILLVLSLIVKVKSFFDKNTDETTSA